MDLTFAGLESEYNKRVGSLQVTKRSASVTVARQLLKNRDRFLAFQAQSGVPALWVMPAFYRENPSFKAYLGNGDPLDEKTRHVPPGRGPFETWEDGATDAVTFEHVVNCPIWNWAGACWEWERWNGFGSREHGRPSSYLWSGTDQYLGGKYVADGVWSRGTWDRQLGCVVIARAIAALDEEIAKGFAT